MKSMKKRESQSFFSQILRFHTDTTTIHHNPASVNPITSIDIRNSTKNPSFPPPKTVEDGGRKVLGDYQNIVTNFGLRLRFRCFQRRFCGNTTLSLTFHDVCILNEWHIKRPQHTSLHRMFVLRSKCSPNNQKRFSKQ